MGKAIAVCLGGATGMPLKKCIKCRKAQKPDRIGDVNDGGIGFAQLRHGIITLLLRSVFVNGHAELLLKHRPQPPCRYAQFGQRPYASTLRQGVLGNDGFGLLGQFNRGLKHRQIRPTALARAKAGILRIGSSIKKAHIFAKRRFGFA